MDGLNGRQSRWRLLSGGIKTESLKIARGNLHQAMQIIRAAGNSYLRKEKDDTQGCARWINHLQALAGNAFGNKQKIRLALYIKDFTLLILNEDYQILEEFQISEHLFKEVVECVRMSFKRYDIDSDNLKIDETQQACPESPSPLEFFKMQPVDAFAQYSNYFNNADYALQHLISDLPDADPVRCHPNELDIATRIIVDKSENPERMKSIGAGLSAGDIEYPRPYFYVIPRPCPDLTKGALSELPAGTNWHKGDWTGAVLEGVYLTHFDTAEEQSACCLAFFDAAVKLSISLLQQA